jgi:hypothetical protein
MASVSKALNVYLAAGLARRASSPAKWLVILFGALAAPGCAHLGKGPAGESMPHGTVCQIVTTWNHQVVYAPDPVHAGAPTPGVIGRLYLFGQEISYPLVEEGSAVVDLYDDTKANTGEARPPLEEWRLDPATLKRLVKRDTIGWGYTLFLPWATYKPDIKLVHLKIRYEPAKGTPLYAESGPLTLDDSSGSGNRLAGPQTRPAEAGNVVAANR